MEGSDADGGVYKGSAPAGHGFWRAFSLSLPPWHSASVAECEGGFLDIKTIFFFFFNIHIKLKLGLRWPFRCQIHFRFYVLHRLTLIYWFIFFIFLIANSLAIISKREALIASTVKLQEPDPMISLIRQQVMWVPSNKGIH